MNRIKDFFYDKNDIFVALIILAVAALIIYTRIDKIMAYPDTLLETDSSQTASTAAQATTTAPTQATTAAATTTTATTAPAQTSKSIVISDDAISTTVSQQLADAGLVSSAADFEAALQKANMTSQIRSGTYTIPVGSTNEQIIELITGKTLSGQ